MYCFNGINAAAASFLVEFLFFDPVESLENLWLYPAEIWSISINGAFACRFVVVYAPPIISNHASIQLDIIRVVEDFVRGRESEVLCKLTASSAAFYALPRQLLRCSAGETARGRRRRWQLLLWLGFLCVKLRDWGPSRGGDNRRRHWCRR